MCGDMVNSHQFAGGWFRYTLWEEGWGLVVGQMCDMCSTLINELTEWWCFSLFVFDISTLGMREIGLEEQANAVGHSTFGAVGQRTWSGLFRFASRVSAGGPTNTSDVSVMFIHFHFFEVYHFINDIMTNIMEKIELKPLFYMFTSVNQIRMVCRPEAPLVCCSSSHRHVVRLWWHSIHGNRIQWLVYVNGNWVS